MGGKGSNHPMTTLPLCKKTKKMLQAEALAGKSLEEALPELLNLFGWQETVRRLHTGRSSINYWLLRLRITSRTIYIPPGYRLMLIPEDWQRPDIDLTELEGRRFPGDAAP